MASPASPQHFRNLNATGQNVTNGKAHVVKIIGTNSSAAAAFIQIFDMDQASVVLGTTIPLFTVAVASTAGFTSVNFERPGQLFDTRMSVFSTTAPEGNTGSANGVFLQAWIS